MGEPAKKLWVTYAEYLAMEEASPEKHEWVKGEVRAMSGGTPDHALVIANVGGELHRQLRGRPYRVHSESLRVRVLETDLTTYPDVSVVCGRREFDPDDNHAVVNPIVLVEVLSPSTEGFDRGAKFAHYRRIPSLREYVLVAQEAKRVEVFRRGEDGIWTIHEAREGETIDLLSIGCKLAVDEVYAGAGDEESA